MAKKIIEKGRSGKTAIGKWGRKMVGKGNFAQAEGFMKKYVPSGPEANMARGILNIPRKKTIAHENALDQLGGTLTKIYGKAANAIWSNPMASKSIDMLVGIANKYVPVLKAFVNKIKSHGLKAHELTELKLLFQNSMADAIMEEYQKEQEKLPEDQQRPITSDDIADLFASHKDFAQWLKSDVDNVDDGRGLPKTKQVLEAVNQLERRSGDNPASLKALQDDTLETIRKLHSMGLLDSTKLFDWLKSSI